MTVVVLGQQHQEVLDSVRNKQKEEEKRKGRGGKKKKKREGEREVGIGPEREIIQNFFFFLLEKKLIFFISRYQLLLAVWFVSLEVVNLLYYLVKLWVGDL